MKALIKEINKKIKQIIIGLEEDRDKVKTSLSEVEEKIEQKLEEAESYKKGIETAKGVIRTLEDEITSLENDLNDLKERFNNKDLKVILETGNKEISAQIQNRQKEITKQKEKINELTEKTRMMKDLLDSLEKDKDSKKEKLNNINSAYAYYQKELTRIIEFSEANPDELKLDDTSSASDYTYDEYEYEEENEEDKDYEDEISFEPLTEEPEEAVLEESTEAPIEEADKEDFNLFESNNLDDVDQSLDDLFKKDETNPIDFKDLNETIDKEYENIFGSSEDINVPLEEETQEAPVEEVSETEAPTEEAAPTPEVVNIFDTEETIAPFEEVTEEPLEPSEPVPEVTPIVEETPVEEVVSEPEAPAEEVAPIVEEVTEPVTSEGDEVADFFQKNGLDFNNFSEEAKEKIRSNFNVINYTKTLDILRKNNIKLDCIYNAADIFRMIHSELENLISKLLLAGQTTQNISYVINALPQINSIDLQDVIESYGDKIKDANITDLIIKAKHLKELGGGNN